MGKTYRESRYRDKNKRQALLGKALDHYASDGLINFISTWPCILEVVNVLYEPRKHKTSYYKRECSIYEVALAMFDLDKWDTSALSTRECRARKVMEEVYQLKEGTIYNVQTIPKEDGASLPFTVDSTCEFCWNENYGNNNAELYAIYDDMSVLNIVRYRQDNEPEDKLIIRAEELKYGNVRQMMYISCHDMPGGTVSNGYSSKFNGLYLPKYSGLETIIYFSKFRKK